MVLTYLHQLDPFLFPLISVVFSHGFFPCCIHHRGSQASWCGRPSPSWAVSLCCSAVTWAIAVDGGCSSLVAPRDDPGREAEKSRGRVISEHHRKIIGIQWKYHETCSGTSSINGVDSKHIWVCWRWFWIFPWETHYIPLRMGKVGIVFQCFAGSLRESKSWDIESFCNIMHLSFKTYPSIYLFICFYSWKQCLIFPLFSI